MGLALDIDRWRRAPRGHGPSGLAQDLSDDQTYAINSERRVRLQGPQTPEVMARHGEWRRVTPDHSTRPGDRPYDFVSDRHLHRRTTNAPRHDQASLTLPTLRVSAVLVVASSLPRTRNT